MDETSRKDAAALRPFRFFQSDARAWSTLYTSGVLSHAPQLGGRRYINRPAGGGGESSSPSHASAPQPLASLLLLLSEAFARN